MYWWLAEKKIEETLVVIHNNFNENKLFTRGQQVYYVIKKNRMYFKFP